MKRRRNVVASSKGKGTQILAQPWCFCKGASSGKETILPFLRQTLQCTAARHHVHIDLDMHKEFCAACFLWKSFYVFFFSMGNIPAGSINISFDSSIYSIQFSFHDFSNTTVLCTGAVHFPGLILPMMTHVSYYSGQLWVLHTPENQSQVVSTWMVKASSQNLVTAGGRNPQEILSVFCCFKGWRNLPLHGSSWDRWVPLSGIQTVSPSQTWLESADPEVGVSH